MSTFAAHPGPSHTRVGDVQLRVSGFDTLRRGTIYLTGDSYRHSRTVRTHRTEVAQRRASRPHVAVAYPDVAAFARVQQCLGEQQAETAPAARFRRAGSLWELAFADAVVHLPDLKGLADLATLIASPGREIHSLDLAGGHAPGGRDEFRAAAELEGVEGDLGEVIDARARVAYRARAEELLAEVEDARVARDPVRSERAQAELAAIHDQLEAAYGLGGRVRRSGNPAERARSAVTARIRAAIRRVESAHPALGRHLKNSVRTGTWCVYAPEAAVSWELSP
jgi:hypothetical protein